MLSTFAAPADALGYLLLAVAEQRFGCAPAQLDAVQREEAERIARRQAEIESRVLASREAAAVIVPAAEIDAAVANIRARYTSDDDYEIELRANGLDTQKLRAALARELRVELVLEQIGRRVAPLDDTEIRLYYYLHQDRFEQPETREARHLLITINPTFAENRREEALRRIEQIAKRLAHKPERFAEQAMKHSECPTALQGGTIGRVKRGSLYPQLDATLFALREGAVSAVVESDIGFHIVLCEKIYPAGVASLASVMPELREQMQAREIKRAQKQWLGQLFAGEHEVAGEH